MTTSLAPSEPSARTARPGVGRLVAGGLICAVAFSLVPLAGNLELPHWHTIGVLGPLYLVFAGVAWWVLSARRRLVRSAGGASLRALFVVVLLAGLCQVPGLFVAPQGSTDAFRYVWDGRVQLSGTSPYRYAPLDDALAPLRDPFLFPRLGPDDASGFTTLPSLPSDRARLREVGRADPRTRINRPRVPTIYPPVAQGWFAAVASVTPWPWGTRGLQLASALLAVAMTAGLGLLLGRRGRDPARALLFGWSPVVALEAGNGAHVDIVAAVLVLAAVVIWRRPLLAGAVLGLAAGVKLTPLLLLPAWVVLRPSLGGGPRRLLAAASAAGVLVLVYLPHVLAAGDLVLGYLPSYLVERGLDDGHGFAILDLIAPSWAVVPLAAVIGVGGGLAIWWRANVDDPARTALHLSALLIFLLTPPFAWYALPLVALAVLVDEPRWLIVPLAAYVATSGFGVVASGVVYLAAGLVVLVLGRRSSAADSQPTRASG